MADTPASSSAAGETRRNETPLPSPPKKRLVILGKMVRRWEYFDVWELLFVLLALAVLVVITSLTVFTVTLQPGQVTLINVCLLICEVFSYFYLLLSVFCERAPEMGCFLAAYTLLAFTVTTHYVQDARNTTGLAALCIVWIFLPPIVVASWRHLIRYRNCRRAIARLVGERANSDVMSGAGWILRCRALLALDFQLTALTLVYAIRDSKLFGTVSTTFVLTAGAAAEVTLLVLASLTMRLEKMYLFIIFIVVGLLQPAYSFYEFAHVLVVLRVEDQRLDGWRGLDLCMAGYVVMFLAVRIALIVCMERVQSNFGANLNKLIFDVFCVVQEPDMKLQEETAFPQQAESSDQFKYRTFEEE